MPPKPALCPLVPNRSSPKFVIPARPLYCQRAGARLPGSCWGALMWSRILVFLVVAALGRFRKTL